MLTGRLVRVRFARDRILPQYVDATAANWLEVAERLLGLYRAQAGRTRGAIEQELKDASGDDPSQLVHQGLAKLLEDRCEFEVVAGRPPEELREQVFRRAAAERVRVSESGRVGALSEPSAPTLPLAHSPPPFDRAGVLHAVAVELGLTPEAVEQGLFADLKGEQRLIRFKDLSAERLVQRYNVALAQAVLLRSTAVHIQVRGEPPRRYRQLLRRTKFHRLVCEVERGAPDGYVLHLDGPLSLFTATQKYGLQLALFLPAVLRCRDFELHAELLWGAQRKPKTFVLTALDGLISDEPDTGMHVPAEVGQFAELFRQKVPDWDIAEETAVFPLGTGFWVPDYRLTQRGTGRVVYLEVLGFWRRASVEQHLDRLRQHAGQPFVLAVSDQLKIDDATLDSLPAGIHRFRQMPQYDEIARLASALA